jgi:F-type H+-transporting ATPase subunit a
MSLGPLEQFEVKSLIDFFIGDYDLSLTNSAIMMGVAVFSIVVFLVFALKKNNIIPTKLQMFAEISYDFVRNIAKENIGDEKYFQFFPFIYSMFMFFLIGNLLGNIPYSFSFTSQAIITVSMAVFVLVIGTFYGIYCHGIKFFKIFYPEGIPLILAPLIIPSEIISYFAKALSMGIRLFANMVAGHLMLEIFSGFVIALGIFGIFPLGINVALIGLELFMAVLQAYIFTVLSCIFIGEVVNLH